MDSLDEKKEQVLIHYRKSYDLDIAMMKVDLTTEEKKLLLSDPSFMYRVHYADALIREEIVETMVDNMQGGDPKLSQKAAIDLGNILWPDKFKGKDSGPKQMVPDTIVLKGVGAKP